MSMLVARMMKMKAGNLSGMEKHNKRIFQNHSNEDIDTSLSDQNYDLINREGKYKDIVAEIIESQKVSDRATRKDAVLVNEWIITSDRSFFKDLDPNERDRFFQEATDWFKERYGQQNMAYAQVHLDETTPHMHLGVVPMRDGKLQAKNVFNREELRTIQEELPKYLREKGFDLERGEEKSQRKNLTIPEFKEAMRAVEELKAEGFKMGQEINYAVSHLSDLKSTKNVLESEIEAQNAFLKEYKERSKRLTEITQQRAERPLHKAPEFEAIYQPEISTDLLDRNIKIKKDDYEKMMLTQQRAATQYSDLSKSFNELAKELKNTYEDNHKLAQELVRAKNAIPIQTDQFVSKEEYDKVAKALLVADQQLKEKNSIINQLQTELKDLGEKFKQFKLTCAEFIKEKRHQAFELLGDFAKKLNIVKDVNQLIREEKALEELESQKQEKEKEPEHINEKEEEWEL